MTSLPDGWALTTLDAVAKWGSGGTPRAGVARYYGGSTPWAVIGDLNDGVVTETTGSITPAGLADSSAKIVPKDTVLLAMYGSIGKLGIAGMDMATNQAIASAQTSSAVTARYLFWYLRSQRSALMHSGKGATQKNISQTLLRAWPIPVPPLHEQRRIVEVIETLFARLDAAELSVQSGSRKIQFLRHGAIAQAFAGHWPTASLGEISSVDSGPAFRSEFFGGAEDGIKLLRGENIEPGRLRWRDTRTWPLSKLPGHEHLLVAETDVILAMDRPLISTGLKLAPVRKSDLPALLVQRVARIRPGLEATTSFLRLALQLPRFIPHLLGGQTGTQLPHITLASIRAFEIPLPPIDEQLRLVRELELKLSLIDSLQNSTESVTRRASAVRQSVLSRAFHGELVPQDSNDEPAQLLLRQTVAERATAIPVRRKECPA